MAAAGGLRQLHTGAGTGGDRPLSPSSRRALSPGPLGRRLRTDHLAGPSSEQTLPSSRAAMASAASSEPRRAQPEPDASSYIVIGGDFSSGYDHGASHIYVGGPAPSWNPPPATAQALGSSTWASVTLAQAEPAVQGSGAAAAASDESPLTELLGTAPCAAGDAAAGGVVHVSAGSEAGAHHSVSSNDGFGGHGFGGGSNMGPAAAAGPRSAAAAASLAEQGLPRLRGVYDIADSAAAQALPSGLLYADARLGSSASSAARGTGTAAQAEEPALAELAGERRLLTSGSIRVDSGRAVQLSRQASLLERVAQQRRAQLELELLQGPPRQQQQHQQHPHLHLQPELHELALQQEYLQQIAHVQGQSPALQQPPSSHPAAEEAAKPAAGAAAAAGGDAAQPAAGPSGAARSLTSVPAPSPRPGVSAQEARKAAALRGLALQRLLRPPHAGEAGAEALSAARAPRGAAHPAPLSIAELRSSAPKARLAAHEEDAASAAAAAAAAAPSMDYETARRLALEQGRQQREEKERLLREAMAQLQQESVAQPQAPLQAEAQVLQQQPHLQSLQDAAQVAVREEPQGRIHAASAQAEAVDRGSHVLQSEAQTQAPDVLQAEQQPLAELLPSQASVTEQRSAATAEVKLAAAATPSPSAPSVTALGTATLESTPSAAPAPAATPAPSVSHAPAVEAASAPAAAQSTAPSSALEAAPAAPAPDAAARVAATAAVDATAPAASPARAPRYCDSELTHGPPDDEVYLGERDAAQQAAEALRAESPMGRVRSALSGIKQRLHSMWEWRPWGAAPAASAPPVAEAPQAQPSAAPAAPERASTAAEAPARTADPEAAVYDDIMASLRSSKEASAASAPPKAVAEPLPQPAEAVAKADAAAEAVVAELRPPTVAVEAAVETASPVAPPPPTLAQAAAAEAEAAAVQGRVSVAPAPPPTLTQAAEAATQPAAEAAAEALAARTLQAAAAISATKPVDADAVVRPLADAHAAVAAAEQSQLDAAAAAAPSPLFPPPPSSLPQGAGMSLLDLIRSPAVQDTTAWFATVRATAAAPLPTPPLPRQRKTATKTAAAIKASQEAGAAVVEAAAARIEDLAAPLWVAAPAAEEPSLMPPAPGMGERPAQPGAQEHKEAHKDEEAQRARAMRELMEWRARMQQAKKDEQANWAAKMASALSSTPRTAGGAAGASAAAMEPYTDETAAGLDDAPLAAAGGGRRLFGEPQQVIIPEGTTVRGLASLLGVPLPRLESFLREDLGEALGSELEEVSPESAELAALEFGRIGIVRRAAEGREGAPPLLPRQPVVTILGHVDHGKTSLLDSLRNSRVAAGEAGGITQHIGAFEVALTGGAADASSGPSAITFVDTPGHEAFSAMRARGAAVTDIAVLVVAADEGVKPQTREALAHARSAGCPVVVAITKCDKPTARPDFVKSQLAGEGLELEDFGGSVQVVHTSANTGEGLQELEEALLLQAELMELRAPFEGPAAGSVIEARRERGQGPVATVIVKRGTLKIGDHVVVGTEYGRVKALQREGGIERAGATGAAAGGEEGVRPGQYALVAGLEGLPQAGDSLTVVPTDHRARSLAAARRTRAEEFRRLQLAAALHAQRHKEAESRAEEYSRRRALKADMLRLLAERKSRTAELLRERSAQLRAAAAGAGAAATAADPPAQEAQGADAAASEAAGAAAAAPPLAPVAQLNLIVKADVQGSMEAVLAMVEALAAEQQQQAAAQAAAGSPSAGSSAGYVAVKVVYSGVGPLSPSDLHLATAAGAHVVLFNASISAKMDQVRSAQAAGVRLLQHNIVYSLMDAIRAEVARAAEGAAAGGGEGRGPEALAEVGAAEVLATFPLSSKKVKDGRIAGVRVVSGEVSRGSGDVWRVLRGEEVVWEGPATSIKHLKQDVPSVAAGQEAGVVLAGGAFSAFLPGDRLVCLRRGGAAGPSSSSA